MKQIAAPAGNAHVDNDEPLRELTNLTSELAIKNSITNREQTETLVGVASAMSSMTNLQLAHQEEIKHTGASLRTLWALFVLNIVGTWGVLFYVLN